jgi:hypothetical protein
MRFRQCSQIREPRSRWNDVIFFAVSLAAAATAVAAAPFIAAAASHSHADKETIMYDQSKPYAPLTADNAFDGRC